MKIKLADWASIAEILGAVAIVISLVFVGFQINDGNRETRAATTQAILDSEMFFQAQLLRYPDIWIAIFENADTLDPVESRRAIVLFNMAMTLHDNKYQMGKAGYLEYSGSNLRLVTQTDFYGVWRASPGANSRSKEFMEFADGMRIRGASE